MTVQENADPDVVHDLLLWLNRHIPKEVPGFRHAEGNSDSHLKAAMVGPSPGPDPWAQVPDAEVSRLYANDTLALGGTLQAYLVRGEGAHRHVILVQTGSLGRLRYGWRALVLGCHEGACRGSLIGHAERAAIPAGLGCGLTFRTYRPPPDAELPMLRVAPGSSPGALVLTPHARVRDTCGVEPETVRALAPFHLAP